MVTKSKYYYYLILFTPYRDEHSLHYIAIENVAGIIRLHEALGDNEEGLLDFAQDFIDSEILSDFDDHAVGDTFGLLKFLKSDGYYLFSGNFAGKFVDHSFSLKIQPLYTFENEIGENLGHVSLLYEDE